MFGSEISTLKKKDRNRLEWDFSDHWQEVQEDNKLFMNNYGRIRNY